MTQKPRAAKGMICPYHKVDVSKVCHVCPLWVQLRGKHPQTGGDLDEWSCAHAIMPLLMIETAKQVRSGVAATESFRNEMVGAHAKSINAVAAVLHQQSSKLLEKS